MQSPLFEIAFVSDKPPITTVMTLVRLDGHAVGAVTAKPPTTAAMTLVGAVPTICNSMVYIRIEIYVRVGRQRLCGPQNLFIYMMRSRMKIAQDGALLCR